ncbi:hypothetical protein M011DRAFT_481086 [Sporormia fimetaria CBS 119925]|uniref:Uncharacterized protein n=1 Tax=Sporormia fimetaria CBS 119925 TaxID=1340428 RepID=A0A6A6V1D9_9PLEO|nr:hypothetical protein M011DRAFT_481086 [Sporormia fimetaria CBS 119925]
MPAHSSLTAKLIGIEEYLAQSITARAARRQRVIARTTLRRLLLLVVAEMADSDAKVATAIPPRQGHTAARSSLSGAQPPSYAEPTKTSTLRQGRQREAPRKVTECSPGPSSRAGTQKAESHQPFIASLLSQIEAGKDVSTHPLPALKTIKESYATSTTSADFAPANAKAEITSKDIEVRKKTRDHDAGREFCDARKPNAETTTTPRTNNKRKCEEIVNPNDDATLSHSGRKRRRLGSNIVKAGMLPPCRKASTSSGNPLNLEPHKSSPAATQTALAAIQGAKQLPAAVQNDTSNKVSMEKRNFQVAKVENAKTAVMVALASGNTTKAPNTSTQPLRPTKATKTAVKKAAKKATLSTSQHLKQHIEPQRPDRAVAPKGSKKHSRDELSPGSDSGDETDDFILPDPSLSAFSIHESGLCHMLRVTANVFIDHLVHVTANRGVAG